MHREAVAVNLPAGLGEPNVTVRDPLAAEFAIRAKAAGRDAAALSEALLGIGDNAGPCRFIAHVLALIVRLATPLCYPPADTPVPLPLLPLPPISIV